MFDTKLKKAHKKDKSSFRCVACQEIKNEWGKRVFDGSTGEWTGEWVCSEKCSGELTKKPLSS